MIKRIVLKNFQKHRQLKIRLDPKITTIVGPTDSGKSSIVRAIKWAVLNCPSGDSFVHDEERTARVVLHVDGHRVARSRGKRNLYSLDQEEFVAFGSGVPESVSSILRMDEINFQEQHDSSFWFSSSPGEVSRHLNRIVNLEIIDTTLSELASKLRRARAEVEIAEERVEEAQAERERLRETRAMDRDLKRVEALEKKPIQLGAQATTLSLLIERAEWAQQERAQLREAAKQGRDLLAKGAEYERIRAGSLSIERLATAWDNLRRIAKRAVPATEKLQELASKWAEMAKKADSLEEGIQTAEKAGKESWQRRRESRFANSVLIRRMGQYCPLCRTPLNR